MTNDEGMRFIGVSPNFGEDQLKLFRLLPAGGLVSFVRTPHGRHRPLRNRLRNACRTAGNVMPEGVCHFVIRHSSFQVRITCSCPMAAASNFSWVASL